MQPHAPHHQDTEALVAQAVARLRVAGERITPARRDMLTVLAGSPEHLSADEVVSRMTDSRQTGTAHRTTVYRTLERFAAAGIVVHQRLPGGATGYHLRTDSHLHGHCVGCQAVVALPTEVLEEIAPARERMRAASGFEIDLHGSTLLGRCGDCRGR
ncbi:transcriptional repressor [Nocardiopsis kunsanensis]|uniref:Transcriptional repressor n=1 Tax=Nocardiopsis kunsanensis TaxID=141693 RepID=A0A918XLM9_9ACTN|nr:Fur family transcriptional regulator [Nocardiopsis kunsanensis]GHD37610.1 transcriptional repressor [Nocardiopsis kunsanensis]